MLKRMVALIAAAAALTAPAAGASAAKPEENIVETASGAPQFSTLVSLVKQAGLVKALSGNARLTVFAPTDAAFAKVPKKTLNALARDRQQLRRVLLYHVIRGGVGSSNVVKRKGARTLEGSRLSFRVKRGKVFVNQARVIAPDIRASNGVVHAIDRVLLPPAH